MDYCCTYNGARAWREEHRTTDILKKLEDLTVED